MDHGARQAPPSTPTHRLKSLAQSSRRRTTRLLHAPLEFWRGYNYGRKADASNREVSEPVGQGWLENYFDEVTTGPGLWKWRHYFPIYERHFSKFRGKEVHIIEIGVYSGGSLGMWQSYFGDNAHVYGVDIEPACRSYEDGKTQIFIGDQADKNFWQQVINQVPRLDIIVDDGGHQTFQQVATLEALLPHLQPGGVYLCEDLYGGSNLFHSYIDGLSRNLHDWKPTSGVIQTQQNPDPTVPPGHILNPSELQRLIESIHIYPYITVIEARANKLEQMSAPKHGTEWQPF